MGYDLLAIPLAIKYWPLEADQLSKELYELEDPLYCRYSIWHIGMIRRIMLEAGIGEETRKKFEANDRDIVSPRECKTMAEKLLELTGLQTDGRTVSPPPHPNGGGRRMLEAIAQGEIVTPYEHQLRATMKRADEGEITPEEMIASLEEHGGVLTHTIEPGEGADEEAEEIQKSLKPPAEVSAEITAESFPDQVRETVRWLGETAAFIEFLYRAAGTGGFVVY